MKLKRLISSALMVALLLAATLTAFPVITHAAYSDSESDSLVQKSTVAIKSLVENEYCFYNIDPSLPAAEVDPATKTFNFTCVQDVLEYEKSKGYIKSVTSADGTNSVHVNIYTGVMYFVNEVTGQIITSNPTDFSNFPLTARNSGTIDMLGSQLSLSFIESANNTAGDTFNSFRQSAARGQISVEYIRNGLRVNYTLGDTTLRALCPARITIQDFEEQIFKPIYEEFKDAAQVLVEYANEKKPTLNLVFEDFFNPTRNGDDLKVKPYIVEGILNFSDAFKDYCDNFVNKTLNVNVLISMKSMILHEPETSDVYQAYRKLKGESEDGILNFFNQLIVNSNLLSAKMLKYKKEMDAGVTEQMIQDYYKYYPVIDPAKDGLDVLIIDVSKMSNLSKISKVISRYTDYTFSDMYEDENQCGYEEEAKKKPVFRMALEYVLNEDGTLGISLPASSISFDRVTFTVTELTILPYLGAGDMRNGGYTMYPDGSGSILEFEDFYAKSGNNPTVAVSSAVYGHDYCHSGITGQHSQQITMPVYGIVNTVAANTKTKTDFGVDEVENGFFAIYEEGDTLLNLNMRSGGNTHNYIGIYGSFTPFAIDEVRLGETMGSSFGASDKYVIYADVGYTGSYTIRLSMLTDPGIAETLGQGYDATYAGMADCYRTYLTANGVLNALASDGEGLPLYIEVIGSMEIDDKFLSFPITRTIPLTAFDDVVAMYTELSAAGIKNINFRLMNVRKENANGGYPLTIRWERACGGKRAFKNLLNTAAEESAKEGYNFGVYPDFDIMYLRARSALRGVTLKNSAAKTLDSRYAYKRLYESSKQSFSGRGGIIIAPQEMMRLYEKLQKKLDKYDLAGISISSVGGDLSSNFDEDNFIDRDGAKAKLEEVLAEMSTTKGYSLMTDTGNVYTVKYVKHILNACTDSSHFRFSSYAVPFAGMVLHGAVNYAGTAINYSGTPAYDVLRAIENGAALYYTLCYQNITFMKENPVTNKYYSVDYQNWKDSLVETYNELNGAIGSLTNYTITAHRTLIGERLVTEAEREAFYETLYNEYLALIESQLTAAVDAAFETQTVVGAGVKVTMDAAAIKAQFLGDLGLNAETGLDTAFVTELISDFDTALAAIKTKYEGEYNSAETDAIAVTFDAIDYSATKYSYLTDSEATDGKAYKKTEFTNDNGNIVLVTYTDEATNTTVKFILNYNIYAVNVKLDGTVYRLSKYSYVKIPG